MEGSYIIPIYLKETEDREKNIFSNLTGLKLQEKQITVKDVVDTIEKNLQEIKEKKKQYRSLLFG